MVERPKALLVGWDAADWEHMQPLLAEGKLPVTRSLIDRGVAGNLATLQPVLSPMLWNSVATGKQAHAHGVHGFLEPDPDGNGARPWSSSSRKTKAIWNILSQSGYRPNVVNWWASHPAEPVQGCIVSNLSLSPDRRSGKPKYPRGVVHPEELSDDLASLAVEASELSGDELLPFVPNGKEVNQDDDSRLGTLAKHLAEMVTTHNLATAVMEQSPWDFMAVYYTAIDHFCHTFMPYHPPRLPWVSESDFEMYKDVVETAYRFSDMTLGRLIHLAGPDATVILCSDHGFQSGAQRLRSTPNEPAGPAYWHRKYGVFVAAGPKIKRGERVYGATLLDICPTLLQVFGLPAARDMPGRVLVEIFDDPSPAELDRIESWDDVPSDLDGVHRTEIASDPAEAAELVKQFVALGYVDAPGDSAEDYRDFADVEAEYNLARNLTWCRRYLEAAHVFADLVRRKPYEDRFILHLARSLSGARRWDDARKLLGRCYDLKGTNNTQAISLWADAAIGCGLREEAVEVLNRLEPLSRRSENLSVFLGTCNLRLRRYDRALAQFECAVALQPDNAEAYLGLSTAHLVRRDHRRAADTALTSIELLFHQARAHNNLGVALARTGEFERAEIAFQNALKIAPHSRRAHRHLRSLYSGPLRDDEKAAHHRDAIHSELATRSKQEFQIAAPIVDLDSLGEIPPESERAAQLEANRPRPANVAIKSGKTFTIVSGLPRSGTSLMMQMLAAGGLSPQTDEERVADEDNPRGYLEWEAIKQIRRRPQILDADGVDRKAIKVVAPLLPELPYQHEYRVIFMDRPIAEVAASQVKMMDRLDGDQTRMAEPQLRHDMAMHRQVILAWLEQHPRAEALVVAYHDLVAANPTTLDSIAKFVGEDRLPNPARMREAIDPALYRNRADNR